MSTQQPSVRKTRRQTQAEAEETKKSPIEAQGKPEAPRRKPKPESREKPSVKPKVVPKVSARASAIFLQKL